MNILPVIRKETKKKIWITLIILTLILPMNVKVNAMVPGQWRYLSGAPVRVIVQDQKLKPKSLNIRALPLELQTTIQRKHDEKYWFQQPVTNMRIICGWWCYRGHYGIDLIPKGKKAYGQPIYAAHNGYVVASGYDAGYGYYVKIKHPYNDYATLYGHMTSAKLKVGTYVMKGQQIGKIGATGNATTSHLHFELYKKGKKINPCKLYKC